MQLGRAKIEEVDFDSNGAAVRGDPGQLETLFHYVIQNSLEALDPQNALIRISSPSKGPGSSFIKIEVFNAGVSLGTEDVETLFVPFYSSKTHGTGSGLSIAQLAARKNPGDLYLEPVPGLGTRCIIKLAVTDRKQSAS